MKPSPLPTDAGDTHVGKDRAPRLEELHNERIINTVGAELITPDPAALRMIEAESFDKVKHFPTPREAFEGSDDRSIGEAEYARLVVTPFLNQLTQEFPDRHLALRAVGVSINGDLSADEAGGLEVPDAVDAANRGTEKPGETFNVAAFDPAEPLSTYQITHYVTRMAGLRALEMEGAAAHAVFPAVLVYDSSGLQDAPEHGQYGVRFAEGHDPGNVLLGVRILDTPA